MTGPKVQGRIVFGIAALALAAAVAWGAGELARKTPAGHRAIEPVALPLPGEVVGALQEGRYKDALASLAKAAEGPKVNPDDKAYLALVRGIALRLDGRADEARAAWQEALKAGPTGTWAPKLRAELATAELAAGHAAEAETLARVEAEALLGGDRKDRLAGLYRGFAESLLHPENPATAPDFEGAYALLAEARTLAQGAQTRAKLLLEMARASRRTDNHARTLQDLHAYLAEYPKGAERPAARLELGDTQLAAGQAPQARLTWSDLARELEGKDEATAQQLRADALYRIPATFGIPTPPDDTQLGLGVSALRRALAFAPTHPAAAQAAFDIAAAYQARGKATEALAAFREFLEGKGPGAEADEARRRRADLVMAATFRVGQVQLGQAKFDEAVAAWRGYLSKFPDGPQSADAQRAILDTQWQAAGDLLRRKQYEPARAAWRAFAAANPLDGRVPEALFLVGEASASEEKFPDALAAWELLAAKFPGTEPAAHARFRIAEVAEQRTGDPALAVEQFRKVDVEPWASQARQRVAVMESRALTVVTPRTFRSGETPHLKVGTRNIEKLTFTAYKLNPESYYRKKHNLAGVEALDIGLVAPDAEWTAEVKGFGKFKPVDAAYDLDKKVAVPGIWVVKVTDESHLQATTLVLGSDVDALAKASRDQFLLFAQDMKTGKGRAGARVLLADKSGVILEAKTGDDGVLLHTWDKPRAPDGGFHYLVLDGPDAAGTGLGLSGQVAQGLTPRGYLYTDRPAYRPGQEVQLRGVIREVDGGQYVNRAESGYRLDVLDSQGRRLVSRPITLSAFGTFHDRLPLDPAAPLGAYTIKLAKPGGSEFAGQFEVQAYQVRKVELRLDLPRTVYYRGEPIKADAIATDSTGIPLASRPIVVQLPDGRTLSGQTDRAGKFPIELPTEGFAEEQALRLIAQLPEDGVAAAARVFIAVRAFGIGVETARPVYLDGESISVQVTTLDAAGAPTGQSLNISVRKRVEQAGQVVEREVSKATLATDAKTGKGTISLKVDDADGGTFVVVVAGTDRFTNAVVAEYPLLISGKTDEAHLRILADRQEFKVGETAKINLHSRGVGGTALVAWEADRILSYKLLPLREGDNDLSWEVDAAQAPNFTLTAARMAGDRLDEARLDVAAARDLRVEIVPTKPSVNPGEVVEVEVRTTDQLGRPVAAELSLALVDRALLRLHGDNLPPIGAFFHDRLRIGAFATTSTNTFRYAPATVPVPEAIVEEAQRAAALAANAEKEGVVRQQVFPDRGPMDIITNVEPGKRSYADIQAEAETAPNGSFKLGVSASSFQGLNGNLIVKGRAGGMGGAGMDFGADPKTFKDITAQRRKLDLRNEQKARRSVKLGGFEPTTLGDRRAGRKLSQAMDDIGDDDFDAEAIDGVDPAQAKSAGRPARSRGVGPAVHQRVVPIEVATEFARYSVGLDFTVPSRRRQVVETAYWNPSVVTDAQGKAKVTLRAPGSLSRYEFTARGVTAGDTLAGQAHADLEVRKDFAVDLKTPAALTEGDKPRFVARLAHRGVAGQAKIRLTITAGGRDVVQPKEVELKGDGVEEVLFDPFEVPVADALKLVASAEAGASKDEVTVDVPVRPWGVPVAASASGTATGSTTAFVTLPPGRPYERPELVIELAPTAQRMLIELALGRHDVRPMFQARIFLPLRTTADRASDLLAASSVLLYLREIGAPDEGDRLAGRVRDLVAELTAAQRDDGGWSWVTTANPKEPSDRATTALVLWALRGPWKLGGMVTEPQTVDKAVTFLQQGYGQVDAADFEGRAAALHALATWEKATFEQANALGRDRQALPDAALAYLALTFQALDRPALASEVLGVLAPRAKAEKVGPGREDNLYWTSARRGPAEATALAALAFAEVKPAARERAGAVAWLEAHRGPFGWGPGPASGPALAALAKSRGKADAAADRYRLTVTVGDTKVETIDVAGAAEPRTIRVPAEALKGNSSARVRFDLEGQGTFGYVATLSGFARDFRPEQEKARSPFVIGSRSYLHAAPELDGRPLPTGWNSVINPKFWQNLVTQVPAGGRATIQLQAWSNERGDLPAWKRDPLILREELPAGTTLVNGTVQSGAARWTLEDGVLTFYFAPGNGPGTISYDVFGALPGTYRALPPRLFDAYDPARVHLGPEGILMVLSPGEKSADPYRATPDELYARGKRLFDAGKVADAAGPLEEVFNAFTLNDDVAKDVARMLLEAAIAAGGAPQKVVKYFEIVKEKAPDLVLTFDRIAAVGRAYRDIGESERAYLVWRAVAEASYLEDARIGEALRQRGRELEGAAFLLGLWREYPDSPSIRADLFGLSRLVAGLASRANSDMDLRREMTAAEVTRPELQLQAIRLVQAFLASEPKGPMSDEASLALVGDFLDLEDYDAVVKLARRFATLYPRSTYLDSFQYSEALGRFHLGDYDRAIAVAEAIAKATYKAPDGTDQPSPNKWQALYILGQIHDARRQPAKALTYYQQVVDRFTDAAGAVKGLERVALKLPEVSVVRPARAPAVASGVGLRALAVDDPSAKPGDAAVTLDYRNVAEADVTVYPVDLMRLYLARRTLDGIAGVDLAGISPLHQSKVKLGDGADYDDKTRSIDLPLTKEGAYLVMARGGDRYTSGVVLVSPLEIEVLEEPEAGRVRVTVRDARTKDPAPRVQVKVIGSDNPAFLSGQTDLRGVFIAEGVRGKVTAVARRAPAAYAFYRGTAYVGQPSQPNAAMPGMITDMSRQAVPQAPASQAMGLEDNIRQINSLNCQQQVDRLQSRSKTPSKSRGVQVKDASGDTPK